MNNLSWLAGALVMAVLNPARAELNPCRFNFGMAWQGPTYAYPQEVHYITLWTGAEEDFNVYWDGAMLKACLPGGKLAGRTPVYYSYIVAFTARRDQQLKDCDVGTPNLCQKGANFIRQNKPRILGQCAKYASETAKIWGTTNPIIWLMEPDYYQYASDANQEGGPLTITEAGAFMGEMVATIKKNLPNAVFSLDISPWIANPTAWYAAFDMGAFTYINTSGGRTEADDARIRKENTMTWSAIHALTKKPIIADDGYGVAGASTGHDATWDLPANLNARIGDGVVAITQANPKADWNGVIAGVRGQLQVIPDCSAGIKRPLNTPLKNSGSHHSGVFRNFLGRWIPRFR